MSLGPRGRRWIRFSGVGLAGLIVQLVSLWVFTRRLGVHYLVGTVAATELAILHNFRCHVRWTWADRPASRAESFRRLLRFHLANGAISMSGNFGLMAALVELAKMPYLLANLLSVAACSLANFLIGDLVVFAVNRVEGVAADGAGVPILRTDDWRHAGLRSLSGRVSTSGETREDHLPHRRSFHGIDAALRQEGGERDLER